MRDIKHPNLCLFIGACIDTDHVAILNEVCGKGSLEDILSNDDIDLGWDFRYSMLKVWSIFAFSFCDDLHLWLSRPVLKLDKGLKVKSSVV